MADKDRFHLSCEDLSETEAPVLVTQNEFMRRMTEMSAAGGGNMFGKMPESYNLVLNSNHPLMAKILHENDAAAKERIAKQTVDLALLGKNLLKGEALTGFIKRSIDILN